MHYIKYSLGQKNRKKKFAKNLICFYRKLESKIFPSLSNFSPFPQSNPR
ncbi:hypothetical protein LEP1GSC199_3769 [Leptospira vanthielii serovar Holland str. Waz Holland = ATCC 700522]|uniref:Uncharacterized protein n=1 Tax=Leptospira vanthielii serovar Holland str. Waz Holland = ATCC 700522 TaxID=1218591 RepID=N1W3H5_9LEPT|nr:hypothetical protein LEP1GSC199_3769 [Leptospira vanthielii serovar Holland str. Waz Holland = ATCC 700522]